MNSQITILILTENISNWKNRILKNLKILKYKKCVNGLIIETDLFVFKLMSTFPINSKASVYSIAILDKYIDSDIEYNIIRPCVKRHILYGDNFTYFKGDKD